MNSKSSGGEIAHNTQLKMLEMSWDQNTAPIKTWSKLSERLTSQTVKRKWTETSWANSERTNPYTGLRHKLEEVQKSSCNALLSRFKSNPNANMKQHAGEQVTLKSHEKPKNPDSGPLETNEKMSCKISGLYHDPENERSDPTYTAAWMNITLSHFRSAKCACTQCKLGWIHMPPSSFWSKRVIWIYTRIQTLGSIQHHRDINHSTSASWPWLLPIKRHISWGMVIAESICAPC